MKKLFVFISLFLTAVMGVQAVTQTVPVDSIKADTVYNIKHVASGLYLQHLENGDGDYCINTLIPGNAEFEFDFTATGEDTFNIRVDSSYLTGDGWNIQSGEISETNPERSRIILLPKSGSTNNEFEMRAEWESSNYINFNDPTAGNRIYADKSSNANSVWVLEPAAEAPSSITVQSYSPTEDAIDVNNSATTAIKITFDAVPALSGSGTATFDSTNAVSPTSVIPTVSGLDLIIPHDELAYNTSYTVTISDGFLSNYTGELTWSFTTSEAPELPQADKRYNIKHSTGKYLTIDGSTVKIADKITEGDTTTQVFTFIADAGTPANFNISTAAGYLYNDGGYNARFKATLTEGNDEEIAVTVNGAYINLRALSRSGSEFLGINNAGATSIYFNKAQSLGNWKLEVLPDVSQASVLSNLPASDATEASVDTSAIISVTFDITPVLAENPTGATFDVADAMLPASVVPEVSGLSLIIPHDRLEFNTTYTVTIPAGYLSNYTDTITWSFTTHSEPVLPQADKRYNIKHSTGKYLTIDGSTVKIADKITEGDTTAQVFIFRADASDTSNFNIETTTEGYLYNDGGWNARFKSILDGSNNEEIAVTVNGAYINLRALSRSTTQFLAINNEGSTNIYFDKAQSLGNWQLEILPDITPYEQLQLDIAKDQAFLDAAVIGDYFAAYPQSDSTTFATALSTARGIPSNALEAVIITATETLAAALATFKSSVNQIPNDKDFNLSVLDVVNTPGYLTYVTGAPWANDRLYWSGYIDDNTNGEGLFSPGSGIADVTLNQSANAQYFMFELVDGTTDVYNIKAMGSGTHYLYSRGSVQDLHIGTGTGAEYNWKLTYNQTVGSVNYYTLNANNRYAFFDTGNGQIRGNQSLGGDNFLFSIEEKGITVGISEQTTNDPVVSEKYYSLQGVEIHDLTVRQFVIVRRTHQSGKQSSRKILLNAR